MCLAPLERSSSGDFGYEAGGALGTSGRQRSEDLPGSGAFLGFVTREDLACDDRRAQLAFGQVVGGINAIVIQKGKEMIRVLTTSSRYSVNGILSIFRVPEYSECGWRTCSALGFH
jgi:hypothetical protein